MVSVVGKECAVALTLGSSSCVDLVSVAGLDSVSVLFLVFCPLFVLDLRFFSILPVVAFGVTASSWYDFEVCARVEDRVVRSTRGTLTEGAMTRSLEDLAM